MDIDPNRQHQLGRSHLFLVRLWAEEDGNGSEAQWHGRVQDIVSGEAHNFDNWTGLISLLLVMLPPLEKARSTR